MSRESVIQRHIVAELRLRGCYVYNAHGSIYSIRGTPDLLVCCDGRFVALEVKQPGRDVTSLQEIRLGEIRRAGGAAAMVRSVDDALAVCGLE